MHHNHGRFTASNVCRGLDSVVAEAARTGCTTHNAEASELAAMLRRCLGDLEDPGGLLAGGTAQPGQNASRRTSAGGGGGGDGAQGGAQEAAPGAQGQGPRSVRGGSGSIRADRGHIAMRGLLSMLRRVHDHQSLLARAGFGLPAEGLGGSAGGPGDNMAALLQGAQLLLTVKATVGALSALMEGILDTSTRLTQYLSFWKAQRRRWQVTVAAEQGPRELLQWLRLQGRQGMLKFAGGAAVEGAPRRSVDESVHAIEIVIDVHLRILGRFKRLIDEVATEVPSWNGVQQWVARALSEMSSSLEVENIDVVLMDDRVWQEAKRKRKHRAEQFGGRTPAEGDANTHSAAAAPMHPAPPSHSADDSGWDVGVGHDVIEKGEDEDAGGAGRQRPVPALGSRKRPAPLGTWSEADEDHRDTSPCANSNGSAAAAPQSISLQSVCAALHIAVVKKWPAYRSRLDYALADLRPPSYLRRNWPRYGHSISDACHYAAMLL